AASIVTPSRPACPAMLAISEYSARSTSASECAPAGATGADGAAGATGPAGMGTGPDVGAGGAVGAAPCSVAGALAGRSVLVMTGLLGSDEKARLLRAAVVRVLPSSDPKSASACDT